MEAWSVVVGTLWRRDSPRDMQLDPDIPKLFSFWREADYKHGGISCGQAEADALRALCEIYNICKCWT